MNFKEYLESQKRTQSGKMWEKIWGITNTLEKKIGNKKDKEEIGSLAKEILSVKGLEGRENLTNLSDNRLAEAFILHYKDKIKAPELIEVIEKIIGKKYEF